MCRFNLLLEKRYPAVAELGGLGKISNGFRGIGLDARLLKLTFRAFSLDECVFFIFPFRFKLARRIAQVGDLFLYDLCARARFALLRLRFFFEGLALNLEASHLAMGLLQDGRFVLE